MSGDFAILVSPVPLFSDMTTQSFYKVELEKPIKKSIKTFLTGNAVNKVTNIQALGSVVLSDEGGDFAIGFFVDREAEIHGKIVDDVLQPARLNVFATLIRRAAMGIEGENPITVAPVAGRLILCGVDDDKNPLPLTESQFNVALAQFADLLGSDYIGDEKFDQKFLNWMVSPAALEGLEKVVAESRNLSDLAGSTTFKSIGDMPYPEQGNAQKRELVN